jgi:hypothetical protein
MLHRSDGSGAANRRAERYLHGNLLVARPLRVNIALVMRGYVFEYLARRRARISGRNAAARFPAPAADRLVAAQYLFLAQNRTSFSNFFLKTSLPANPIQ